MFRLQANYYGLIFATMKIRRDSILTWASIVVIVLCGTLLSSGQGVIGASKTRDVIRHHEMLASAFEANGTNAVPLLLTHWFFDQFKSGDVEYCRVYWSRVERSGNETMGASSFSNGASSQTLDRTNLQSLIEVINKLPSPPKGLLPYERQIVISGIRSNQWFHAVYDRANIPKEVEKLYQITGAHLEKLPNPQGKSVAPIK